LASCAHESKVQPSSGHIDGQNDRAGQPGVAATNANDIPKPITKSTYLPPPKPKTKEPVYSIVVYDTPVKEVLFAIARDSKFNVDIHPSIKGNVTLNAVDQTLPAILERISKQVDLTYKIQGNVLNIAPDSPVLRTYQINYVNMQRTTKGSISVANEIASASNTTVTGAGGSSSTTSSSGSGANNTSATSVESESKNYFWDSLIQNIKDILLESDKEILISRLSSDATLRDSYNSSDSVRGRGEGSASSAGSTGALSGSAKGASASGNQELDVASISKRDAVKESNAKEYRQLFAANVIANKETGVLSVRATERQHRAIQEFIDRVQTGAKRQVLIEASIVEITLNDDFQAGVDWSRLGKGGALDGFTFQQNLLGNELISSPRFAIGYNKSTHLGDLAASIRLLQTFGDTRVLSSPKLMVLNSQTAILKVVNNLVYFTVNAQQGVTNNGTTQPNTVTTTPHTIPVGVWMSVTPQINENTMVTLNVRPTIARQSGEKEDPNPALKNPNIPDNQRVKNIIPEIEVREMESMLQVGSGNTVVLGGLMQDEIVKTKSGIPGLVSTPVIGNAFGVKNSKTKKTELVIFLRPTVIKNASLESDELANYKQYLPTQALERANEFDAEVER
jgi:general secretion pathway protein D